MGNFTRHCKCASLPGWNTWLIRSRNFCSSFCSQIFEASRGHVSLGWKVFFSNFTTVKEKWDARSCCTRVERSTGWTGDTVFGNRSWNVSRRNYAVSYDRDQVAATGARQGWMNDGIRKERNPTWKYKTNSKSWNQYRRMVTGCCCASVGGRFRSVHIVSITHRRTMILHSSTQRTR